MSFFKKSNLTNLLIYLYLTIYIYLFCYTLYRAEFIHSGNQFSYYYKYYLIFIFGIFFWILVLFLKKKLQIVIIVTILLFFLYFYETLTFFAPSIIKLEVFRSINKLTLNTAQLKEKSKYDVIQDLKKSKNIDVVPSVFPKVFFKNKLTNIDENILPLGGVSNTTTVFCKEGETFSIYKSDRYGFNNPDQEWNNEKIVWFLIGDSFVQGSCVQPGDDFASRIRMLTKQSAISLGMSGNGPLTELASLKEYSFKKSPKVVLWFYFERNDLEDLRNEKSNSILMNYLNENFTQHLHSKQLQIDKKLNMYIQHAEKEYQKEILKEDKDAEKFLSFKKIIRLQILRDKTALDRGLNFGIDPLFEKIMIEAKNFVNDWDGRLYFIYLPDKERYSSKKIKDNNYLNRSEIIELINNLDIPLIDIHEDFFIKQADPIEFFAQRIYGHYSPDGYNEISKVIINKINLLN